MAMRGSQPLMVNAELLWAQVRQLFWEELDSIARNEVREVASFHAPHMYKGVKSGILPLLWELKNPDIAPPRSMKECRLYSLSIATGLQFVIKEYLGTPWAVLKKGVEQRIPSSLPQNLERYERLLRKYNEPVDRWLNTRLRTYAGSLVDCFFGRYKRYHPLPPVNHTITFMSNCGRALTPITVQAPHGTGKERGDEITLPGFPDKYIHNSALPLVLSYNTSPCLSLLCLYGIHLFQEINDIVCLLTPSTISRNSSLFSTRLRACARSFTSFRTALISFSLSLIPSSSDHKATLSTPLFLPINIWGGLWPMKLGWTGKTSVGY